MFGKAFQCAARDHDRCRQNREGALRRTRGARHAIEQQPPGPHYQGVFQEGKTYSRGSMVTKAGGLWLALEDTMEIPGRSERWRLVVKSGEAQR